MKKLLAILLCLAMVLGMAACGEKKTNEPTQTAEPTETITWKAQGFTSAGTLYDTYGKMLADRINGMTGGRLVIEWYGGDSIVASAEVAASVRDGILDACVDYSGQWTWLDEAMPLFCSSPGVFSKPIDMIGWMYYGGGLELWQKYADEAGMNMKIFLQGVHDMEDFLWSNEPITEISDLTDGKIVRMMPVFGNVLAENGVSVAFLSGAEIVSSMERGVIDAGEYSIPSLDQTFGFQDVAKYVARPGFHQPCATQCFAINLDRWNELPEDLQHIVEEACRAQVLMFLEDSIQKNIDSLEFFKSKGITVTQLSDDCLATLSEWTDNYYAAHATPGTKMREIVDSQQAFIKKIAAYNDSMAMPYPSWAY